MIGFDWPDYLVLASHLATRPTAEAALRSAISRASYPAFGADSERLIHHGWQVHTGQLHHRDQKTDQDSGRSDWRRIGELGFNLRDQRTGVDYLRLRFPTFKPADEVQKALPRANRILTHLDR